jgi:hypothetical protein
VFLSLAPGGKAVLLGNDFSAAAAGTREETMDAWKGINTPDRR